MSDLIPPADLAAAVAAAEVPLRKFAGVKPLLTIQEQCLHAGIDFVDDLWRAGDDCVGIWTKTKDMSLGYVIFNTFNGRFFGKTPEGDPYEPQGTTFSSENAIHEGEAWYQDLLNFFYMEKTADLDTMLPRDATKRIDPNLAVWTPTGLAIR